MHLVFRNRGHDRRGRAGTLPWVALAALSGLAGSCTQGGSDAHAAEAVATARLLAKSEDAISFALHPLDRVTYVVGQAGTIRPLLSGGLGAPALDVIDEVRYGGEQGLLGAAFSNDGAWLYTNDTDNDGVTRIIAWPFADGKADPGGRRVLLTVKQPWENHNGGHLEVDSKGALWIGLGDGGNAGDPKGNGQNTKSLLGKMLRILPTPTAKAPYAIPAGNLPATKGRPEIWATGLRNPWTFQLDEKRGVIWIADVGQDAWEEVNAIALSAKNPNLGWSRREGTHAYKGKSKPAGAIDPVAEYKHGDRADWGGCSVTGAVVRTDGSYLYSDYCTGWLRAVDRNGKVTNLANETGWSAVTGFGVDAKGMILLAQKGSGVYALPLLVN